MAGNVPPVEIISPTPEQMAPSPEELFAAHVELVRTTGDAFDERANGKLSVIIGMGMVAGLGAVSAENIGLYDLTSITVLSSAAGLAAVKYASTRTARKVQAAAEKLQPDTQAATGNYYELYRTSHREDGTYNVAMHWLGVASNPKDDTCQERIRRVAELAQTNDIDELVVPHNLSHDYHDQFDNTHDTTNISWIAQRKRLQLDNETGMLMRTATPAEWIAATDMLPPTTEAKEIWISKPKPVGNFSATHSGLDVMIDSDASAYRTKGHDPVMLEYEIGDEGTGAKRVIQVPVRHTMITYKLGSIQEEVAAVSKPPDNSSYHNIEVKNWRLGRKIATVAAVVGSVLAGGQMMADNALAARDTEARAEIGAEQGLSPDDMQHVTVDQGAVKARVDKWAFINRVWDNWREARSDMHDLVTPDPHGGGSGAGSTSGISGAVGNVDSLDTSVQWTLTPLHASPDILRGHWTVDTASILNTSHGKDGTPVLSWDMHHVADRSLSKPGGDLAGQIVSVDGDARNIGAARPAIEVTGKVGERDDIYTDSSVTSIPVLDGFALEAANIDGKPVDSAIRKVDGTYVVEGNMTADSIVQYWIVPDNSRKVRAAEGLTYASPNQQANVYDRDKMKEIRDTYLQGITTPEEYVDYMHRNFFYSYTPWPMDKLSKATQGSDLMQITFEEKKAVCNVAATSMVLTKPEFDLNAEFGYENSSSDLTHLTNNEAHARTVDRNGKAYDPTPTRQAIIKPITPDKPAPLPIMPLGLAAVGLAAASVGVKRRAQLAKSVSALSHMPQRLLTKPYQHAVAAATHAYWAGPGSTMTEKDMQANLIENLTVAEAKDVLANPELHNEAMRNTLRNQPLVGRAARALVWLAARKANRQHRAESQYDPFATGLNHEADGLHLQPIA